MVWQTSNHQGEGSIKQTFAEIRDRIKIYSFSSIPRYIIDLIGFRLPSVRKITWPAHFQYRLKNGDIFNVRPFKYDRYIVDEIYLERAYFPDPEFTVKDNDVVVDIGAHIGVFTVYAARQANCIVYSYEPRPDNFGLLEENICLNRIENRVRTFQYAVGGISGSLQFSMDSEGLGRIGGTTGYKIAVHTTTLKEILDSNNLLKVDFLKIDVEGAELDMLLNLPREYFSRIEKISMESHTKMITVKVTAYLSSNGFSVKTLKLPNSDMSMIYAKRSDC